MPQNLWTTFLVLSTAALSGCGSASNTSTPPTSDSVDLTPVEQPIDDPEPGVPLFDPTDVDGDGILNVADADYDPRDLDGDGIVNLFDDDVDGDGIANDEDSDFVPDDADGNGFTDAMNDGPCLGEEGVDSSSVNSYWSDNCRIARLTKGGIFADSLYTVGIQRILYCLDFSNSPYAGGSFGPITEQDMMSYQSDRGLVGDGVVRANTWSQLQQEIVLLGSIDINGVSFDSYGFNSGRCESDVLFYQEVTYSEFGDKIIGGWKLSKDEPNRNQMVKFSIALPYDDDNKPITQ